MPACVLRYCTNRTDKINKSQGVTFHSFPRPEHEKREEWIKFVQKNRSEETWLPSAHTRICSVHFKEDHKYTTKEGRVYLKKSAVPCDSRAKFGELEASEPLSASVSDSESIFDTPRKIKLKIRLSKESAAKKKLAAKIKKVQRQNVYLKQKCASYKAIVKQLKDKFCFDLNSTRKFDCITKQKLIKV